ncbi:unnamed protein product [Clavelina lepadiformis]|uniref:Uncharacterized protein n=1 Tax=Clavelina lepadiformis TaxID=159417 RepID=A0ABP0F9W0_CLALP
MLNFSSSIKLNVRENRTVPLAILHRHNLHFHLKGQLLQERSRAKFLEVAVALFTDPLHCTRSLSRSGDESAGEAVPYGYSP